MSLIASSHESVLSLFENDLAQVRFPGLDVEVLRSARQQVEELALEVEKAEAILQSARTALLLAQQQFGQKCTRAVAYAKVYAEENPEVAEKLAGLGAETESLSPAVSEPRKRRNKKSSEVAPLFEEQMAASMATA